MKPTRQLHDLGQSLWLDNITREQAGRPNLLVKIPGTPEGIPAIEESIFAGVPVNVIPLFSREQYLAAAGARPQRLLWDVDALAIQLQREGAQSFVKSWQQLLQRIADKSAALASTRRG